MAENITPTGPMNRIFVVGTSGVGKTTLARHMGRILGLPVFHLDRLGFVAGWVKRPQADFARDVDAIMTASDNWVIEGNYNAVLAPRAARAEMLVLIDLPLWLCLVRVFGRWWKNRGHTRSDLPAGCIEPLPWTFLMWVLKAPPSRQKVWLDLAANMPHLTFVHLKSAADVAAFTASLKPLHHDESDGE